MAEIFTFFPNIKVQIFWEGQKKFEKNILLNNAKKSLLTIPELNKAFLYSKSENLSKYTKLSVVKEVTYFVESNHNLRI